jgi:hypothetical protein
LYFEFSKFNAKVEAFSEKRANPSLVGGRPALGLKQNDIHHEHPGRPAGAREMAGARQIFEMELVKVLEYVA